MGGMALTGLRIAGIAVALFVAFMWWGASVRQDRLFSPVRAFGVSELVYVAESSGGIGPGANESGIRVFAMPESLLERIALDGVAYLNRLPRRQSEYGVGQPWDWKPTPVPSDDPGWTYAGKGSAPALSDIMERYWHTDVAPEIRQLVDRALGTEGNLYVIDRNDLFVMILAERKLVFAYGG